jgi:ubiquitin C-terminal hydrolase
VYFFLGTFYARLLFGEWTDKEFLPSSVYAHFDAVGGLVLNSSIACKCGYVSRTDDHAEGSLSLPIKPRIKNGDVSSYCESYFTEVVEGYRCDKCTDTSKKWRKQAIVYSPDILLVQLKRFDWEGTKDGAAIGVNALLDLNRFRDTKNQEPSKYELTAVIKHSGNASFSGHYIAFALGPDGRWTMFNDSQASASSLTEARGIYKGHPYLLFYQRII